MLGTFLEANEVSEAVCPLREEYVVKLTLINEKRYMVKSLIDFVLNLKTN